MLLSIMPTLCTTYISFCQQSFKGAARGLATKRVLKRYSDEHATHTDTQNTQELDSIEAELQGAVAAGSADPFCLYLLGVVLLDK